MEPRETIDRDGMSHVATRNLIQQSGRRLSPLLNTGENCQASPTISISTLFPISGELELGRRHEGRQPKEGGEEIPSGGSRYRQKKQPQTDSL